MHRESPNWNRCEKKKSLSQFLYRESTIYHHQKYKKRKKPVHTRTHIHTYTVSGIGSVMESCSKWCWNWYWKYHWKSRATFNHVGWSGLRPLQLGSTIWFRYVFQVLLFFCDFLFFQNFQIFRYWKPEGRDKKQKPEGEISQHRVPTGYRTTTHVKHGFQFEERGEFL